MGAETKDPSFKVKFFRKNKDWFLGQLRLEREASLSGTDGPASPSRSSPHRFLDVNSDEFRDWFFEVNKDYFVKKVQAEASILQPPELRPHSAAALTSPSFTRQAIQLSEGESGASSPELSTLLRSKYFDNSSSSPRDLRRTSPSNSASFLHRASADVGGQDGRWDIRLSHPLSRQSSGSEDGEDGSEGEAGNPASPITRAIAALWLGAARERLSGQPPVFVITSSSASDTEAQDAELQEEFTSPTHRDSPPGGISVYVKGRTRALHSETASFEMKKGPRFERLRFDARRGKGSDQRAADKTLNCVGISSDEESNDDPFTASAPRSPSTPKTATDFEKPRFAPVAFIISSDDESDEPGSSAASQVSPNFARARTALAEKQFIDSKLKTTD